MAHSHKSPGLESILVSMTNDCKCVTCKVNVTFSNGGCTKKRNGSLSSTFSSGVQLKIACQDYSTLQAKVYCKALFSQISKKLGQILRF